MSLSMAQKRKDDGTFGGPDINSRARFKRFRPTIHTIRTPLTIENEVEAFPTDRITSDPNFFDDFMPEESRTSPQPTLPSLRANRTTSPMPARSWKPTKRFAESSKESRSLSEVRGNWLSDDEDVEIRIQSEPDIRESRRVINVTSQKAQLERNTSQSQEQQIQDGLSTIDKEEELPVAQERTDLRDSETGIPNSGRDHILSPTSEPELSENREQTDVAPPVREPTRTTNAGTSSRHTIPSRPHDRRKVSLRHGVLSPPDSAPQQSIRTSDRIFVQTSNTIPKMSSKFDPIPVPDAETPSNSLSSSLSDAIDSSSTDLVLSPAPATRGRSSKGNRSRTDDIQFEISHSETDSVYSVKHRKETKSDIGAQWSRAAKRTTTYQSITKHARVRYDVGHLVSLDFSEGSGGSAKILEIREVDADTPLIVVQWLYSRTDAARLGGRLPSLEKWPKGFYMLSDHLQVVSVDNLNGKSGSTPMEDFYWQVGGKCLRPFSELVRKL